MDPNYKEEEDGSGGNSNAMATNPTVKLDASKTAKEKTKKGCCN